MNKKRVRRIIVWVLTIAFLIGLAPVALPKVAADSTSEIASQTDALSDEPLTNDAANVNGTTEESVTEVSKQDSVMDINEVPADELEVEIEGIEETEVTEVTEETEGLEEAIDEDAPFYQQATVGNVIITVTADEGVFPEGSTMSASQVSAESFGMTGYAFDISIYDKDGNEIEPDNSKGEVRVSFTSALISNENIETDIYHMADGAGIEKLSSVAQSGNTVTAVTDGFSYYLIAFTCNNQEYNITRDITENDTVYIYHIAREINSNITAASQISNVSISGDDIFSLSDNKYYLNIKTPEDTTKVYKTNLSFDARGISYQVKVNVSFENHNHGTDTSNYTVFYLDGAIYKYGDYILGNNINIYQDLVVNDSKALNLCLNGHTFTKDGQLIYVYKQFSIYDEKEGKILYNPNGTNKIFNLIHVARGGQLDLHGGSICDSAGGVELLGTFNMDGGSISGHSGDRADNNAHNAGVYISGWTDSSSGKSVMGTFTMTGGKIVNNTCKCGGVYIDNGLAKIQGGEISGNESEYGGIYVGDGTLELSGSPVISGNKYNGQDRNIVIKDGSGISVGELTGEEKYGVTLLDANGSPKAGVFTTNKITEDQLSHFKSDCKEYKVIINDEGKGELVHHHLWDITKIKQDSSDSLYTACINTNDDCKEIATVTIKSDKDEYMYGEDITVSVETNEAWNEAIGDGALPTPETIVFKKAGASDESYTMSVPTAAGKYVARSFVGMDNEAYEITTEFTIKGYDIDKVLELYTGDGVASGEVSINANDPDSIVDTVITENDENIISEGGRVCLVVYVEKNSVSESEAAGLISVAGEGSKLGRTYNINLWKNTSGMDPVILDSVGTPIGFNLAIPEELINTDKNVERTYSIAREHGGSFALVPSQVDLGARTISFSADNFSTYAIMIKDTLLVPEDTSSDENVTPKTETKTAEISDTKTEQKNDKPLSKVKAAKTGDNTNIAIIVALMIMAALNIVLIILKKRKGQNERT